MYHFFFSPEARENGLFIDQMIIRGTIYSTDAQPVLDKRIIL
jgi:hypothetical protein